VGWRVKLGIGSRVKSRVGVRVSAEQRQTVIQQTAGDVDGGSERMRDNERGADVDSAWKRKRAADHTDILVGQIGVSYWLTGI
jgi:hypothetical protein